MGSMLFDAMANRLRKMPPRTFGGRLRRIRSSRGISQAELARRVGISSRMAAYYEVQGGTPGAPLLAKIAKALEVSVDELLGLQGDQLADAPSATDEVKLWKKLREVQRLPERDRRLVLQLIDSLLAKQ